MKEIDVGHGLKTQVDDDDFDLLSSVKWCVDFAEGRPYVRGRVMVEGDWKTVRLHRFIVGAPVGLVVDHIDGNGLNNQRTNLRLATRSQNQMNQRKTTCRTSSRFKGVSRTAEGNWQAAITVNRTTTHLGRFNTESEAARAYDRAAIELHSRFANLNFPESLENDCQEQKERNPGSGLWKTKK